MFRRKDEAYDSNDLLDVMTGDNDDELLETQSKDYDKTASAGATEQGRTASSNDDVGAQPKAQPAAAPSGSQSSGAVASKPTPAAAFRPHAPQAAPRNVPATSDRSNALSANPKASKRVLTVGHDIHMKGEISTCDRLVIEGSVDASLNEVHTVEIAQTGSFSGTAEIEDAEISGEFDGDLIVNGRLTIYSTGTVNGNVAYGEIEIERGGKLTGSIKTADDIRTERGNSSAKKAA